MRIADVHAHIFPDKIAEKASQSIGSFYDQPIPNMADYHTLVELEAAAGVSWCAVSSSATAPKQVAPINDFIAETCAKDPNLIGLGALFPGMDGWQEELERMISLGLKGIKIHPDFQKVPINDPGSIEMYRQIARCGLPVLFHMGDNRYDYSSPERLSDLIRQVPDLIAIAAHFGGWRAWDQSFAHIQPENVYYDTSSSLMFLGRDQALRQLERLGPHRFLYGTDFPMWTPKEELGRFLSLDLGEELNDTILYRNFAKLFLREGVHC